MLVLRRLRSAVLALLPFLKLSVNSEKGGTEATVSSKTPGILHSTSYLDGLRGLASLIVCICHYTEDNHKYLILPWKLGGRPSSFLQMPFIRLVFSGRPMVHIFFIISGFVLSQKPLDALHVGNVEQCYSILASSAFRRPIRLFGPCIVSTFLILTLSYSGYLYDPLPTLYQQLEDWWSNLYSGIMWPWAWDHDLRPTYDIHLWTIPIEYIHSMLLFLVLLVLSPLKKEVRRFGMIFLMLYCLSCGRWAAFEFLAGGMICDIVLAQRAEKNERRDFLGKQLTSEEAGEEARYPTASSDCTTAQLEAWKNTLQIWAYSTIIMFWLFIAGWPNENAERTPGIRSFVRATPEPYRALDHDARAPQKFWFSVSAVGLVWSITQLRCLRRMLEHPVCQYLGRVSYALYIVHGPILNMLQRLVIGQSAVLGAGERGERGYVEAVEGLGIKGWVGTETPTQQLMVWVLGMLVMFPPIFWAADLFWRYVDLPIIDLSRKFEQWSRDK